MATVPGNDWSVVGGDTPSHHAPPSRFCPAPEALDLARSWQRQQDRPAAPQRTFSLSTLFLWMTLVAVVSAAGRVHPVLFVLVVVASAPGSIAVVNTARRRQRHGLPMTAAEKIFSFIAAAGIIWPLLYLTWMAVWLVGGVTGVTVFVFGWLARSTAEWLAAEAPGIAPLAIAFVVATVVGLVATLFAVRLLWPLARNAISGMFNVWRSLLTGEMF